MNWETYLALGDSITNGARSYLSYPVLAGNLLSGSLQKDWNVVNSSYNGYTAADLVRHIDDHWASLEHANPSVTTVLIGTNDAKKGTSAEDYRIALKQVILKGCMLTQEGNLKLLLIPTFPKGVMYPYNVAMNDLIDTYNGVIKDECQGRGLETIALDLEAESFTDGVHLNERGNEQTARKVATHILNERGLNLE